MEMSTDSTTIGGIDQLPEECISHVISFTSPRDACVASAVSHAFRSAADSDATWQRLLPSDYASILSQAVDQVEYTSKKELYFKLCDQPLLINGGSMSFELEKSSGAKIFMISARKLWIVWGASSHYWSWIVLPESRFGDCAELIAVCWLEIRGKINSEILTPNTLYAAYLIFKVRFRAPGIRNRAPGLRNRSFGLTSPFQETNVTFAGTESKHSVCLNHGQRSSWDRPLPGVDLENMADDIILPKQRQDGWLEVELGEFYSGDGINGEVDMSLMEIKGGHWKKGLIVLGIEIRPKH